ncbi:hypothetical protein COOONC_17335, partial [Cooperia oncophora]
FLFFSLSVVVSSLCKLVYEIVSLAGVQSKVFDRFSITVDLLVSYYSALLIFFLGLNRFAAFSSPYLREHLMGRRTLLWILLGLLVFSSVITVVIFEISGMRRIFNQNTITDYANKCIFVQASSYIFYTLPLASSIFYLSHTSRYARRERTLSVMLQSLSWTELRDVT